MGALNRVLVACAAFAVIAYVAYFFYGEWQRHEAEQAAQALALARANATAAAENRKISAECLDLADDLRTVLSGQSLGRRFSQADARSILRNCLAGGHLNTAQVDGLDL